MLMSFTCVRGQSAPTINLSQSILLQVSSDKGIYNLKEPLQMTVSCTNKSLTPVNMLLPVRQLGAALKIYYRKINGEFQRYNFSYDHGRAIACELMPNDKRVISFIMLYDTSQEIFMLSEPGEYELKAVYQDIDDKNNITESNVLVIKVENFNQEDRSIKYYSDELIARLIQEDWIDDYNGAIGKSIFLAKNYPTSFYTSILRRSQLPLLDRRKRDSSLGKDEEDLYLTLKSQDTENLLEKEKTDAPLDPEASKLIFKSLEKSPEKKNNSSDSSDK